MNKFSIGGVTGEQKRSSLLNAEIARMGTGSQLSLSRAGGSGSKMSKQLSPNGVSRLKKSPSRSPQRTSSKK